jgi:hypothetical protein
LTPSGSLFGRYIAVLRVTLTSSANFALLHTWASDLAYELSRSGWAWLILWLLLLLLLFLLALLADLTTLYTRTPPWYLSMGPHPRTPRHLTTLAPSHW